MKGKKINIAGLKHYTLRFQNRVHEDGTILKSVISNIEYLDMLLNECDPDKLTNSILPKIEEVLGGVSTEIETGTEGIFMMIYKDIVTLERYDEIEISIPTLDLKQIVEDYRDFLLTPPLDGEMA